MSQANFFLQFKSVVNKSAELKIVTQPKSNFRLTWAPKVGLAPPNWEVWGGGCYVSGGSASKSHLQKLRILQNKIITASLFCPRKYPTFLLYFRFGVLQLDDRIKMEFVKFAHKLFNKKLPNSFDNYFTDLKYIHNHNTRQKDRSNFYHRYVKSETGRKKLQLICVNMWENIPLQSRNCSFVI